MRLWSEVFGYAPIPFGITPAGQIVSRHAFISGDPPSQSEVDSFLFSEGFIPVRQKYWLWEKYFATEGFRMGLGDARDENFVRTAEGIVPIDVRLWRIS
jgi:hypothetical protein